MTFGEYVRYCRTKDGLPLTDVAATVGISKQMLSQVERGSAAPLLPKHWFKLDHAVPSVRYDELKKRYTVTCPLCSGSGRSNPDVENGA
tara:strand:+ start:410 stop:676 length:267 start_codon:yes stop_codon:yes gene_type:complete